MLVLLSLLFLQAHKAEGFASGPPSYVCDSMSPNHGQAAQTGISTYQINFSKNTYSPNEQIQVTLSGSATFRGFMIQPRLQNSASTSTYGTITPDDAVNTNNPCSEKAALAHKNKIIFRTPVSFVWTAPSFDVGSIVFLYTVVEVMETFWVKNESPPLTYEAPTQAPTTQELTTQAQSTKKLTTQAPTTQAPTTQAPTTQKPTTQAPTTQKPTTQAPTTPELTTQAPATRESTQQPQTSQKHKTQASATQEPTTQAPVTQDTTTLAPTTQKPTTLDQITQELTTQAPTTQEPTTQAPKTEKPTTQAQITQEITTQAPTTREPTTQAQTTQKRTTQAPTTQKPTTPAPTTREPTSQASTTQKPTTQASTTQKPTTQAPTTLKPTTPARTTREPTSQAPTTQKPTTQAPTTQKSTTQAPTTQERTTQTPATQKPATQAPTTKEPATHATTTQKAATHATTTQKAATHAPTTATMINRDPNCDVTLNCFPSSTECSTNCDYLVTWRNVSDTEVEFSLKRKTTDTNYFIAIGFSKDRQMGDDSVVQCVSTDCVVGVRSSYNGAYKSNDLLDEKTFGVSLVSGSYSGGVLSCTFNRTNDADLLSVGSGRRRRAATYVSSFFNLNKEYFLLVAHGEANKGYIRPHSETPKISSTKIDFLAVPDVNNQEKTTAVTINTGNITRDEGCGKNLGCFHDGCEGGKCDFLLTWKDDGNDVELSLSCKMSNNGYCAIGLSSDDKMGDDSVFECVSDGGIVNVYVSYNSGQKNRRLDQPQYGLSSISTSANEGVITCSFRRQKVAPSRRKRASSGSNTFFDMNSDWTLLFAHGSAAAGYPLRHDTAPLVSSQVADFQRFQEIEADSVSRLLIKLHGILMVLAWMLLASIGITMARFYKEVWPEGMEWFQRKRWFVIHRACMVCVFVLTAVSFVIIFIHVGGFAQISGTYFEKSHPIIGIVVMALTVINPIMALFRPHPDTPKRKIFNYAHFGVGSGAHILSVINIFSGAMLASDFLTATAEIVVWIFVAWMIIFYLQQQLYECFLKKKKNVEMKTYDEIMKRSPQKKRDSFKIGFLIVHVFVVVGLGLAVVVMIAVG